MYTHVNTAYVQNYSTGNDDMTEHIQQTVLMDVFHVLQRYKRSLGSKLDPLCKLFIIMMRDAMLVVNTEDEARLKAFLRRWGMTEDEIARLPKKYFLTRCRRAIPRPEILVHRMQLVYDMFEDKKMANGASVFKKGGKKGYFQQSMEAEHASIMFHAAHGCISDPPDLNMYLEIGRRGDGSPIYRCVRGTSQLEGFHHHLADVVHGWVCSPELMDAAVMEFVHRWNIDARIRANGERDFGFYDLEIMDYLVTNEMAVFGKTSYPTWRPTGVLDPEAQEVFGCGIPLHPSHVPLPADENNNDDIEQAADGIIVGDSGDVEDDDDDDDEREAMDAACKKAFGCSMMHLQTARAPQGM